MKILKFLVSITCFPALAYADYTPLILSSDFDGVRADVLTSAGGLISVILIVVGLGILIRTLGK